MVKHKASPKKGKSAGYAAATAPPVNDSTSSSDETSPPVQAKEKKPVRSLLLTKNTKSKKTSKPNTQVFKEIKRLQKTTNLLIPRAPFLRLVTKISNFIYI